MRGLASVLITAAILLAGVAAACMAYMAGYRLDHLLG